MVVLLTEELSEGERSLWECYIQQHGAMARAKHVHGHVTPKTLFYSVTVPVQEQGVCSQLTPPYRLQCG